MEIKEYVSRRKIELASCLQKLSQVPTLSIISIGDDPASASYIRGKLKDSAEVGFKTILTHLDESTSQEDLLRLIQKQNKDPAITGILVQLPVPKQISPSAINLTIDPAKDVDGFTPSSHFIPCTPKGIVDYLASEGFLLKGANAVILGRSQIVGKPMAKLLLSKDCNVTVLHSKTSDSDRRFYLAHADLIVVAIGKIGYLDYSYSLKPSAYVVDVGINRGEDGHLHGDSLPGLKVKLQTPVPGGVGLLTRLALLDNLLEASK